jgi:hypothetical protein
MSTRSRANTRQDKTTKNQPKHSAALVFEPADTEQAFNDAKEEIDAVTELASMAVDVVAAAIIVMGAIPHIMALRSEIAELPGHIERKVDKLETYVLAVWHANALSAPPPGPERTMKKLLEEAWPLRELLLVSADALVLKGHFSREWIKPIRDGKGSEDLANDLLALYALFTREWTRIGGKTSVESTDVARAAALGAEILRGIGARVVEGPVDREKALDDRARAFTLLVNTYEECRRAIAFIRWHEGDLELIAPSPYRRGPRASGKGADVDVDVDVEPDAPPARGDEPATPNGPGARPAVSPAPSTSPTPRPA